LSLLLTPSLRTIVHGSRRDLAGEHVGIDGRTVAVAEMSDSFKAGLEVMRKNVESQTHQVDFLRLL
jgi:hypothetical protein